MKLMLYSILLTFSLSHCAANNNEQELVVVNEPQGYYSDYFVFIANDDESAPLVIPIDINWTLFEDSYEVEYKSWYGTEKEWPITYFKKSIPATKSDIPQESFVHANTEHFYFDKGNRTITTKINGDHEVQIQVPVKEDWVLSTLESDFPTYAFETDITVDGKSRSGYMLYERIRFDQAREFDGFAAFYWMPMVVNNKLYHFTQHRGEQTAVKWSVVDDNLETTTVAKFDFKVIENTADSKSNRAEVAQTVQIQVPEWELDITLKSTGEQLGHGEAYPKGLAVFRQSLLQSTEQSKDSGYGMMELILADN